MTTETASRLTLTPAAPGRFVQAHRLALRTRLRRALYRRALRLALIAYHIALRVGGLVRRRPRAQHAGQPCEILLTGAFNSDNWINAHLRPLAAATRCTRLYIVATRVVPPTPNVTPISPPRWLRRVAGDVPARLLTFAWIALRRRPHYMGGFHLLPNGLATALLARLAGSRALYFCVGGPAEVLGGGIVSENRLFSRLEVADPVIERRLIRAVAAFDLVIAMGTRAVSFFRAHHINTQFHVVSGGIDAARFVPPAADAIPTTDLILVGRLAEIKRVDIFLHAFQQVVRVLPMARASIVGDGVERPALRQLAHDLGIAHAVTFAGQRRDLDVLLRSARLFVLTSDSEGLALSLMEAMSCGLPAVVSNVGDLADLVEDGVNGYLLPPRAASAFAARIVELLSNPDRLARFSLAARAAALRYEMSAVAQRWGEILSAEAAR